MPLTLMRRLGFAAVLTVLAGVGPIAPARAITSVQKFSMTLSPNLSGSVPSPRPASLTLRAWFDTVSPDLDRRAPFATRRAGVHLPKEVTLALTGVPACEPGTVLRDEKVCPSGSQVGGGSLRIVGIGLNESLAAKVFLTPARQLKLLVTGTSPLIVRQVTALDVSHIDVDPQFGPILFATFPEALQSPAPGVLAATSEMVLSFPIRRGTASTRTTRPFVATTGCVRGSWAADFTAEYTTTLDGAYESGPTVTSSERCVAGPGSTTHDRPVPDARDLRAVQVFFRGQAALGGAHVAGRILSLDVAKVPDGASVTAFCARGCSFRRARGWKDLSRAGGEATWMFRKPLVVRRGARVVVGVSSSEHSARLTIELKRRGNILVSELVRISSR